MEQPDLVCEVAKEANLNDADMIDLYSFVSEALRQKFVDGTVDSGMGGGWCDFWIRFRGVEYKLVMTPHRNLAAPQ